MSDPLVISKINEKIKKFNIEGKIIHKKYKYST